MKERNSFGTIKHRHVTEKARMLEELKNSESNSCSRKCESPKYVFIVDKNANKQEIKKAVEEIYKDKKIKVVKVNTVLKKPRERRVRGRVGMTKMVKKAIVTLEPKDSIDDQV